MAHETGGKEWKDIKDNSQREPELTHTDKTVVTKPPSNLLHIGVDPVEEVSDFGKNSGLILTSSGTPRHDANDVILTGFRFGRTDQRTARVTHAGRLAVGAEADHTGPNHVWPTSLQVGVGPDLALQLLQLVGAAAGWVHQTPARKPASFGAMVVISGIGHASGTGIWPGEVNFSGQLDQSDVVFHRVRIVESTVNDDLLNFHISFSAIVVLEMPFSGADAESGGIFGLHEAMSGAKDPSGSD